MSQPHQGQGRPALTSELTSSKLAPWIDASADALARRDTMDEQIAATGRQQAAAADVLQLTEARYRAGIDSFLNVLDAQRSYYSVQQTYVETKRTAAQNRVALYQTLGGDSLLQNAPLCDVTYVSSASSAKPAT